MFNFTETKGRTLEEMDEVFGGDSAAKDAELMKRVEEQYGRSYIPPSLKSNAAQVV